MPGNDYAAVVEQRAPDAIRPGPVVDTAGRTLGQHSGVHHFTVGQRKGLGISSPAPLFVVAIDAAARHGGRRLEGATAARRRCARRA